MNFATIDHRNKRIFFVLALVSSLCSRRILLGNQNYFREILTAMLSVDFSHNKFGRKYFGRSHGRFARQ